MDSLTVDQILGRIRLDPDTRKGSVLDVIQLVTGCTQNNSPVLLERIKKAFPDVTTKCSDFKFAGKGQRLTPVAPVPVLVEIAWLCQGKNAREFRRAGVRTLCRALGGDLSLVDEITARHREVAGSDEQATLLAGTGVSMAEANGKALAVVSTELDLAERRARIRKLEAEAEREAAQAARESALAARESVQAACDIADQLRKRAHLETDERERLWLSDAAKNVMRQLTPGQRQLEGGPSTDNRSITLSGVADEMGFGRLSRADLQAVGKRAAKLYRASHDGEAPPKHDQLVDGAVRQVASYFEKDRVILEQAIRDILG